MHRTRVVAHFLLSSVLVIGAGAPAWSHDTPGLQTMILKGTAPTCGHKNLGAGVVGLAPVAGGLEIDIRTKGARVAGERWEVRVLWREVPQTAFARFVLAPVSRVVRLLGGGQPAAAAAEKPGVLRVNAQGDGATRFTLRRARGTWNLQVQLHDPACRLGEDSPLGYHTSPATVVIDQG